MRKHLAIAAALLAVTACVALAAGAYTVISAPEPGGFNASGLDVGKIVAVQVENASPTNGTFVLSRSSDDLTQTNALLTRTAFDGAISDTLGTGTNIWIMAGDRLHRSGTITNTCRVRIILAEGP